MVTTKKRPGRFKKKKKKKEIKGIQIKKKERKLPVFR